MKPRLIAISGSLRGTVRHLVDGRISLGRENGSGFRLNDLGVSRRHCLIQQVDDRYELADLDSHNGTFLNGIPIRLKTLDHGDTIRIGESELVFLIDENEEIPDSKLQLCDDTSICEMKTFGLNHPGLPPKFGVAVGKMASDLVALFRISDIINSIRDLPLLQRELLRLILEVIPAERGAIVLFDNIDDEPSSVCEWRRLSHDEQPIRMQREAVHRSLWERSAILIAAQPNAAGSENVLCIPLVAVEKTLGVIYLTAPHSAPPFCEDQVHFLGSVSRIAAVTLENILALNALGAENLQLKEELNSTSKLVGESQQLGRIEEFILRVAHSDTTILIRGESGTGKELVARAIHANSPRASRPFIAINCAAIPEALLESELFGHEKGAFTGAAMLKKGKLEAAEDGTVFFDEIGEMAPLLQAKLLRVLQQREFERLGGNRSLKFTARVLAATNKNLEQAIKSGEFRQDLYYRLNVVGVTLPPLREHREDIPLLTLHFAALYAAKSKRPFKGISRDARTLLMNYSWPGNVRELENAIEHAIVLGLTDEILPEDLPASIIEQSAELSGARYHEALNQTKRELIRAALSESGGNYPEAAQLLGIHPKYLHRLVRNLDMKSELREPS